MQRGHVNVNGQKWPSPCQARGDFQRVCPALCLRHTALSYEGTRCHYGNSVIFWDRVFGTCKEGESEAVGQDDRKRLSIQEQWLFPLRPWLEKRGEG